MSKRRILVALLAALLLPALASAGTFLEGNFGYLDGASLKSDAALRTSAKAALQSILMSELGATGNEEMIVSKVSVDELGDVHVRFTQELNGLRVVGGGMMLHAHANGEIFAVNGDFANGADLARLPALDADSALAFALGGTKMARAQGAELVYVLTEGGAHLAWQTTVEYRNAEGSQRDLVFADAATGKLVARHPQHHYGKSLNTQNCNQKTTNCTTVSTSSSPINTGDDAIDAAHNYAIATYDFYFANYGRDSLNNAGMTLKSRAHYSSNYNNAFWDGTQMTYGDGDGTTFVPLSQDADVVAHELTHGVTSFESNLTYSNESGALNESLSDIFGSEVDRYVGNDGLNTGTGTAIWLVGEDIYTPANGKNDGLRDMADPVAAGDYDWYPTRYIGSSDNGGVHWNSGISNLAFVLLSDGGTHPRGKSSVVVPQIGHVAAAKIWYEANVNCASASTNFSGMRSCTATKAASFFDQATADAVHCAWDAVGVPGTSTCGGGTPPPPPPGGGCSYSDSLSGISGSKNSWNNYTQLASELGSGCAGLTISISGGSGDADLYTKYGSAPTTTSYDCRPYLGGNNETCSYSNPASTGTYYIGIRGYRAYSGLTLSVSSN